MYLRFLIAILLFSIGSVQSQEVTLFKQFGGHVDFLMLGNTLNFEENGVFATCEIGNTSSAELLLNSEDRLIAAYLYWAGSGEGDFEIKLNELDIQSTRHFKDSLETNNLPFFAAVADVTEIIKDLNTSTVTISELDVSDVIQLYCPNGTNFAGWAIVLIIENDALPLNQVNIYDGLEHVPSILSITLDNIDVIDNNDAKIGFIAWEGDAALDINESLFINGNLIGNPPLNPANNAFNGTNTFTNSSSLYNMDIDVYDIESNINIGDSEAVIELSSGQDFVMINSVVTKLNSQLPDATISIDSFDIEQCDDRSAIVTVSVNNFNSTKELPAQVSISLYANEVLLGIAYTSTEIAIGQSEIVGTSILIPESELYDFELIAVVNEVDPVLEIRTDNNTDELAINFPTSPQIEEQEDLLSCNIGFETGLFDFSETYARLLDHAQADELILLYPTEEDYNNNTNPIDPNFEYQSISNPQTIFVKVVNETTGCSSVSTFEISVYNCPPNYVDGFSPNNDGRNELFQIDGLYDIFIDFELEIYSRWGQLVYKGNQSTAPWNGRLMNTKELVPVGVYYYIMNLNDQGYQPFQGTVYVSR